MMKPLTALMLPLMLILAACPPPEALLSNEELAEAAAGGDKRAALELEARLQQAALPPLPESPEGELAFRQTLAAGDNEMLTRLSVLGNPWARWHEAQESLVFGASTEDVTRARLYMGFAAEQNVLEARAFLIHAHKDGLYGYPRDPDYVARHLLPLRLDLAEEIQLGNDHYIEVIKALPDVGQN